jgi:diadenosine tetraphosphate (Ap4A) HIT family hydrolase
MVNCPFCDQIKIESRIIYQDQLVKVFPTNIPIVPGHILICPVRHIQIWDELTDGELKAVHEVIVRVKNGLKKTFGAQGFNIAWNEGALAGQSVPHLHIHVVPRIEGDAGIYEYEPRKFLYRPGSRNESPEGELEEVAGLIRSNMAQV